jgi:hypothetical protein
MNVVKFGGILNMRLRKLIMITAALMAPLAANTEATKRKKVHKSTSP